MAALNVGQLREELAGYADEAMVEICVVQEPGVYSYYTVGAVQPVVGTDMPVLELGDFVSGGG